MRWEVPRLWDGGECFIIGGGHSLKETNFDYGLLRNKWVIGCNDAYIFGHEIVDICFFGDFTWYDTEKKGLRKFKGLSVTCFKDVQLFGDWVRVVNRVKVPFSRKPNGIAWNLNTGAAAVNLATLLGVKTIYLLGFDMALGPNGESNWHPNRKDPPNAKNLIRFMDEGFPNVKKGVDGLGVEVFNLNPKSKMKLFPRLDVSDIL